MARHAVGLQAVASPYGKALVFNDAPNTALADRVDTEAGRDVGMPGAHASKG